MNSFVDVILNKHAEAMQAYRNMENRVRSETELPVEFVKQVGTKINESGKEYQNTIKDMPVGEAFLNTIEDGGKRLVEGYVGGGGEPEVPRRHGGQHGAGPVPTGDAAGDGRGTDRPRRELTRTRPAPNRAPEQPLTSMCDSPCQPPHHLQSPTPSAPGSLGVPRDSTGTARPGYARPLRLADRRPSLDDLIVRGWIDGKAIVFLDDVKALFPEMKHGQETAEHPAG